MWRPCLLPLFVSSCVGTYKHTYTIRVSCIINSRLNKTLLTTRLTVALPGSLCMLYCPCGHAPSHFPHTLISCWNPVHAWTLLRWLIDHFICKYTSPFNDSFVSLFCFVFHHSQSCHSFVVCRATTDPVTLRVMMRNMLWRHVVHCLYSADFIPSQETSFQGQNKVCLVVPRIGQALVKKGAFATRQPVANGRAVGRLRKGKKKGGKTVGMVKFWYLLGFWLKAVARYLGFL